MSQWEESQREDIAASERYVAEKASEREARRAQLNVTRVAPTPPPRKSLSPQINLLRKLLAVAVIDPKQLQIHLDGITIALGPEELDYIDRIRVHF